MMNKTPDWRYQVPHSLSDLVIRRYFRNFAAHLNPDTLTEYEACYQSIHAGESTPHWCNHDTDLPDKYLCSTGAG